MEALYLEYINNRDSILKHVDGLYYFTQLADKYSLTHLNIVNDEIFRQAVLGYIDLSKIKNQRITHHDEVAEIFKDHPYELADYIIEYGEPVWFPFIVDPEYRKMMWEYYTFENPFLIDVCSKPNAQPDRQFTIRVNLHNNVASVEIDDKEQPPNPNAALST